MSYNFELLGITPILTFFNYQQEVEKNPRRSKVYLASHQCTLDAFIESTKIIPQKPEWNWDEVIQTTINFWLTNEDDIKHWKMQLETTAEESLLVARIANLDSLRHELEQLL
ncbi:MAG: hypothetical protein Tsb0014_24690 [Pleurocapsa sp.]